MCGGEVSLDAVLEFHPTQGIEVHVCEVLPWESLSHAEKLAVRCGDDMYAGVVRETCTVANRMSVFVKHPQVTVDETNGRYCYVNSNCDTDCFRRCLGGTRVKFGMEECSISCVIG